MEDDIRKIIKDSKLIINKYIHLFLFILVKFIFIKRKENKEKKLENKINETIEKINGIIKSKDKHINTKYTKENFKNIICFIKTQNQVYAGEIIEGILIYTFSFAFYSDKDNSLNKYIFNNFYKFKDQDNYDIVDMFKTNKFVPKELKELGDLLDIDSTWEFNDKSKKINDCVLFNLLNYIFQEKYINVKNIKRNKKSIFYISRGELDNQKISETIYKKLKENSITILDKDITVNSIMCIADNLYFHNEFGRVLKTPINLIRSFLIQVFIYYQNKNSPLMKFITKTEKYEPIPFQYDLRGACIEGRFSLIIISPIRIEPRISRILFAQNNLRECGLYEFGKAILFNKNIKVVEFNTSLLRTNYIEFLNNALGIYDNYSVEVLNISFNYLKDNCEEYLAKLITYFKGLKTINLNSNELKRGISSFLVVLKSLYRKGKINLENLLINKCLLDDASYYELGELLKSKYCKLKKLYLNFNTMPSNIKFLKKLKKNRSLTEIYINKNEIGNNDVDDILRFISNTEVRHLCLYKNKISSATSFLNILYRTKKIKEYNDDDGKEIIGDEPYLINLDLSNNELYIKNQNHIKLIYKIIQESTLYSFDLSHILFGLSPEKKKINTDNASYRKSVDDLKTYLEKMKTNYIYIIKEIRRNEVDNKRCLDLKSVEMFSHLEDSINEVITNEKAIFPVFLKEQARKILNNENNDKIRGLIQQNGRKVIEDKLVNYLTVKRTENKLNQLEKMKKAIKLILI